jgi:hypothetical protein
VGAEEEVEVEVLRQEASEEARGTLIWLHGGGLHPHVCHERDDDVAEGWARMGAEVEMSAWCNLVVPGAPVRSLRY